MKLFSLFLITFNLYAFEGLKYADDDYLIIEEDLSGKYTNARILTESPLKKEIKNKVFNDELNIVNDDFNIPDYFIDNVKFWFSMYAEYNSSQVAIHDKNDLGIIYTVLDFNHLTDSKLNEFTKSNIQVKITRERTREIKNNLQLLSKESIEDIKASSLYKLVSNTRDFDVKDKNLKKYFAKLAKNIRAQTGQRNMVYNGLLNYLPLEKFFKKYFKEFNLPMELLGIPFLESSFNIKAESKVGALGIWQIMPFIAKKFLPYGKIEDGRRNQFLSTIAALHLLKQNKQIMKRWDLAVTAYNSGTKHIVKASKQLKIQLRKLALEEIFKRYKHPHLGFASKNFYSEFLALTRVLAYKKILFPITNLEYKNFDNISFYVTKCSILPKYIFRLLKKYQVKDLNKHFEKPSRRYPKGSIIVSNRKLTSKYYRKVSHKEIIKKNPRQWKRLVRNQSCSTR